MYAASLLFLTCVMLCRSTFFIGVYLAYVMISASHKMKFNVWIICQLILTTTLTITDISFNEQEMWNGFWTCAPAVRFRTSPEKVEAAESLMATFVWKHMVQALMYSQIVFFFVVFLWGKGIPEFLPWFFFPKCAIFKVGKKNGGNYMLPKECLYTQRVRNCKGFVFFKECIMLKMFAYACFI